MTSGSAISNFFAILLKRAYLGDPANKEYTNLFSEIIVNQMVVFPQGLHDFEKDIFRNEKKKPLFGSKILGNKLIKL